MLNILMGIAAIQNLTVNYGRFTALKDFSITIPEGSIGLLGPNGSGKTTLLKALLGFVKPASGSATVLGKDILSQNKEIRQLVGLMPEQDCHIPGMSAVQFVAFSAELAGIPSAQALRRAHEVLEYCGLGEARYRNVETYSTGMRQRIKLAQALAHGPKLLLLDEPTNGLDPNGREQMLDLIQGITESKGLSVIVSSHLLPDIERVCDEMMVLVNGELRAQGKIKDLKLIEGAPIDVELKTASSSFANCCRELGIQVVSEEGTRFRLLISGSEQDFASLIWQAAANACVQVRGFGLAERSLEEAFLDAVRKPITFSV
jgi:ABC-2 type transport system ATP-binding protein